IARSSSARPPSTSRCFLPMRPAYRPISPISTAEKPHPCHRPRDRADSPTCGLDSNTIGADAEVVLEECDANRVIAEMIRVARPGTRIGIVVRAIDFAQWWNLELPAAISAIASIPPQSVGPGGVADASLYARMRHAGLVELRAFPTLITLDQPEAPIWRYREDDVLSRLSPENTIAWSDARERAARQGVLVQAHALQARRWLPQRRARRPARD